MRKLAIWGGIAALLAGLGAAAGVRAGADDEPKKGGWSWVPGWLKGGKKADAEKPAAPEKSAVRPAAPADPRGAVIARELAAWQRRMAVCLELRQVAQDTNDNHLLSQVEQLEERAWATYTRRTGNPPGGSLDEEVLDRHLNAAASGRPPAAASAKGRSNPTAARGR